jgi:hypothetical protein
MDPCTYILENDLMILTVYSNVNSGLLRHPAKQLTLDLKSHKRINNLSTMIKAKYLREFIEIVNKHLILQCDKISKSTNDNNVTILIHQISLEQLLNSSIIISNNKCLELYTLTSRQNDMNTFDEVFLVRSLNRNLNFSDQYNSTYNFNIRLEKVCISFKDLRLKSSILNKKYCPILGIK